MKPDCIRIYLWNLWLRSTAGNKFMEDFLGTIIGKKIDVYCGGASSLRGEVLRVETGVLHLRDDEGKPCYVAIDKIVVVWDARDDDHRAGFMG
jgi:hypothetical protein